MTVGELIELYDEWNDRVRINYCDAEDVWTTLYDDYIRYLIRDDLMKREIVAFGHDKKSTLTIRVK